MMKVIADLLEHLFELAEAGEAEGEASGGGGQSVGALGLPRRASSWMPPMRFIELGLV